MTTLFDLLAKARWQAAKKVPYLARGLWAMTFVEEPRVPTCAVDEFWRVYFNPDYARKCAESDTLIGELIHECLHPTMRHKRRAETIHATDHHRWNVAGDLEIDQRILQAGVKLVTERVQCEAGRETWTAEEHYRASEKSGKKGAKPHCAGGSGAGAGKAEWEQGAPAADGSNAPGLSESDADIVRAQVAHAVREHAKANGRGSVPAGLLRWADAFGEPPPVDYRALVQARVRYVIDTKRGPAPSYARPSRRQFGGMILPVHRLPIATVAMVLDTSLSMSEGGADSDIAKCIASVYGAVEVLGRVTVVPCDAQAFDAVEVRHVDDLKPFMKGGGGTDMRVGIARAEETFPQPDAIVVVTDGDTPWPETAPSVPLVVVLTQASQYPPPAYAEVVCAY